MNIKFDTEFVYDIPKPAWHFVWHARGEDGVWFIERWHDKPWEEIPEDERTLMDEAARAGLENAMENAVEVEE